MEEQKNELNKTEIENDLQSSERMMDYFDENDIYGTAKYDQARIDKIIRELSGLDKIVYDYLQGAGRLTEQGLQQACRELAGSGRDFTTLMLNHGTIKQEQLVELSLKIDPGELSGKELIEPSIPHRLLRDFKIMLHAITDTTVYLSTLSNPSMAERAMKRFFPRHRFHFVGARVRRLITYLEKVEKYGKQQGTLLEVIVRKAVREKCSDIHIYATRDGYNIKTRYLGQLYIERVGNMEEYHSLITKAKLESGLDPSNKRTPQDGQFEIDYNGRPIELRVATCPTVGNKEAAVIRVLDPENSQVHVKELGITRIDQVIDSLRSPNGIFLICGVTGSGKTTTAASAIRWVLDRFSQAINTIEDPVENEISDVKQTQIDPRSGVTFATVLKSILRQDPDVIVLGEIRDKETAQIAFQAAETGHLLIGTLHVKDIRGVIPRLEYLEVDREKIIGQLRGVIVQSLIRTICPACLGKGDNCGTCLDKMYTSRTIVSETVYLRDRDAVTKMMDYTQPKWWKTIIEDAFMKYLDGQTDRRELVRYFGPDFEHLEKEEAPRYAQKVIDGEMEAVDYERLFPQHHNLLTSFVH
jgi:general secretion pathway protein E